MTPLLPLLKHWREGAIGVLVIFLVTSVSQWHARSTEVSKLKLAYANPQVKEVVRIVRVAGPVRVVTKIVEKPSGEKETTIEEEREAETATSETATESTPIPIEQILPRINANRWLLTFGANRLTDDFDGKAFLAGYSWGNRFDLQAGAIRRGDTSPWVFGTLRF